LEVTGPLRPAAAIACVVSPIGGVQSRKLGEGDSADNVIVSIAPEAVIGDCIHIFVRVVLGDMPAIFAEMHEIGRGEPASRPQGMVIIHLRRARPGAAPVSRLDEAGVGGGLTHLF